MPSLNKVMIIGNLTREPELRHTPKGTSVAELGMAINRVWKDEQGNKQEETTFVDVTLWGRVAEVAQQYLAKGSPCYIEGRLTIDTWEDKATGQKRSKVKVIGETLQLLGSGGERQQRPAATTTAPPASSRPAAAIEDEDDDIPF